MLLVGPVALYGSPERLRGHIEALESYGYRCPAFDCSGWESEAAMHRAFQAGLRFPEYYGHNLDALNDCLADLDIPDPGGVALVLWRFDWRPVGGLSASSGRGERSVIALRQAERRSCAKARLCTTR